MNKYRPILQDYVARELYDFLELIDKDDKLSVVLGGVDGMELRLIFSRYLAYRKFDEGDALTALEDIKNTTKLGRSFYQVDESEFCAWFVEQAYGTRKGESLLHVAIVTIDYIIDVITLELPQIQQ